jgi:hypothetical protein
VDSPHPSTTIILKNTKKGDIWIKSYEKNRIPEKKSTFVKAQGLPF